MGVRTGDRRLETLETLARELCVFPPAVRKAVCCVHVREVMQDRLLHRQLNMVIIRLMVVCRMLRAMYFVQISVQDGPRDDYVVAECRHGRRMRGVENRREIRLEPLVTILRLP